MTLRELRLSDAPALHRIARCPDVACHTWPAPNDTAAFERFIEWSWAERAAGTYVCFGIVRDGTTDASGLFELRQMQPGFFRGELGCLIDPALWGTGVFQASARLVLAFAFETMGVHRIAVRAAVDNVRSNVAMHKLGARKEGILRAAFVRDGRYVDQQLWAIVAGLDACIDPGERGTSADLSLSA
ncbi:MAG: GNAT family N-acetyltransferase [Acidobacteria bacterium]|nr:GNAT family N-acetyltransferase [Acidobacteriota bacterium]